MYTKLILKITLVATILIFIVIVLKFKPMYKVTIQGNVVGYVKQKSKVEKIINNYLNTKEGNIAYIDIKNMPEYELNLVSWGKEDATNEVLREIKDTSTVTYRLFAIKLGEENKEYVSTIKEAEQVVDELKQEFNRVVDLDIGVEEIFTSNLENIESINAKVAKANLDTEIIANCDNVIDGVLLSKPLKGTVSSRFGSRWGGTHTGLDIAADMGTPIYACSKGYVKYAGQYFGYGKLVIINHENGIQTYYGHCSKICVSVGDTVTKDTIIGEVGSTGNSTGPHLHLEIRKNGVVQNPQKYLYK